MRSNGEYGNVGRTGSSPLECVSNLDVTVFSEQIVYGVVADGAKYFPESSVDTLFKSEKSPSDYNSRVYTTICV
jgi:hypothetical protein